MSMKALSENIREEIQNLLADCWRQMFCDSSDLIDDIIDNGFKGITQLSDKELVETFYDDMLYDLVEGFDLEDDHHLAVLYKKAVCELGIHDMLGGDDE